MKINNADLGYTDNIIVAFLDILGFSSLIETQDPILPEVMDKLKSDKKFTDKVIQEARSTKDTWIENKREYIEIITNKRLSVLSDSIVISYPFRDPVRMIPIIEDLRNIQLELLTMGILLRGAITMGELYHKDDIIYGPALSKAVYLEEQEAIYPRIIIDHDFYRLFTAKIKAEGLESNIKPMFIEFPKDDYNQAIDFLSEDAFIDYFNFNQIKERDILKELLNIRNNLITNYEIIKGDYSVRRKYDWFIKYYNYSIENNDYGISNNDLINLHVNRSNP